MNKSYELQRKRLYDSLAACSSDSNFWSLAKDVFAFQREYNPLLKEFASHTNPLLFDSIEFSFLPISFFKSHEVKTGGWASNLVFSSSGTTGTSTSRHYVKEVGHYLENTQRIFEYTYGEMNQYCLLCLLPSYLEREGSSLILMCDHFIKQTEDSRSAFYLYDHESLYRILSTLKNENKKTILLGVSYALLDFAEKYRLDGWDELIVMKTGGMKGKRAEINPEELDRILGTAFNVSSIHGEYGMTECQSQLYSQGDNYYQENQMMRIILTDLTDPLETVAEGKTGRINIVDLANIDSCSFIATDDIGVKDSEGRVKILGRIDHSDLRGCNMLL